MSAGRSLVRSAKIATSHLSYSQAHVVHGYVYSDITYTEPDRTPRGPSHARPCGDPPPMREPIVRATYRSGCRPRPCGYRCRCGLEFATALAAWLHSSLEVCIPGGFTR